jgi:hypothetical protein
VDRIFSCWCDCLGPDNITIVTERCAYLNDEP